mmetsp:Transcript_73057/g.214088  ORF Transcript_73057/g.214088 Transcript_73057/m.214088 type:complete len:294 (+) Transcript_73057:1279-2160(+)
MRDLLRVLLDLLPPPLRDGLPGPDRSPEELLRLHADPLQHLGLLLLQHVGLPPVNGRHGTLRPARCEDLAPAPEDGVEHAEEVELHVTIGLTPDPPPKLRMLRMACGADLLQATLQAINVALEVQGVTLDVMRPPVQSCGDLVVRARMPVALPGGKLLAECVYRLEELPILGCKVVKSLQHEFGGVLTILHLRRLRALRGEERRKALLLLGEGGLARPPGVSLRRPSGQRQLLLLLRARLGLRRPSGERRGGRGACSLHPSWQFHARRVAAAWVIRRRGHTLLLPAGLGLPRV